MTQLSKNIQAIRLFLRLSQRDFAAIVGVHESLISRVEKGKSPVSADLVKAVCDGFHVSPSTIYHIDMALNNGADAPAVSARQQETASDA